MRTAALLIGLTLALAGSASAVTSPPKLNEVATSVTGQPAQVRCWSETEWDELVFAPREAAGFVLAGVPEINLSPNVCEPLLLAMRGQGDDWNVAYGVLTLAHEIEHVRGVEDEAEANCRALATARLVARLLGMRPGRATNVRNAARFQWHSHPDAYRKPGCPWASPAPAWMRDATGG